MNINKEIQLENNTLYLVSGVPASGKSTLFKNNPHINDEMVISSDKIRRELVGKTYAMNNGKVVVDLPQNINTFVFQMINSMVEARLYSGLLTFVDATLINDSERRMFSLLAEKYNYNLVVLAFDEDLETVIERDKNREFSVGESVIRRIHSERLVDENGYPTSRHTIRLVNSNTKLIPIDNNLPTSKIDIVGDIHGCLKEFKTTIYRLGYREDENGHYIHKDDAERKLLLMGDYVDYGYDSINTLLFVKKLHEQGHFAIMGNHDFKIVTFYRIYKEKNEVLNFSLDSNATIMDFMRLDEKMRESIYNWLVTLPCKYTYVDGDTKILFCHANIQYYGYNTPSENLIKGDTYDWDIDTDGIYDEMYNQGYNEFKLVRGHIPLTSLNQNSVMSVDVRAAKGGFIGTLKLDELIKNYSENGVFTDEDLLTRHAVEFNYKDVINEDVALYESMKSLQKDKLVMCQTDHTGFLSIFKYSKPVFYKKLWTEYHDLLKARGLVFDISGKIVHHSFDKVFNYSEPNEKGHATATELGDNVEVIAVEKLNGFLGGLSKHPIFENELLNVTSGSFSNDFTGYTMDLILRNRHKGNLLKFFNSNPTTSLMFEVIHEDDPHIIEYDESEHDIYLIGARNHAFSSKEYSEEELDDIALELGLKRPAHFKVKFGDLKQMVKESNIEGYMVRNAETNDFICKFKSPYYLTTKFLGRLSTNQTKFMYGNKEAFKQRIDEEFFDIVDFIVENIEKETFESMDDQARIEIVREYINNSRNS